MRPDWGLGSNAAVTRKHLPGGHRPGLNGGSVSASTSKVTARILRTENLQPFDSEPFWKSINTPVNDSLGSVGKSNPGKIQAR